MDPTYQEIKTAYLHLKRLFSTDSIALFPIKKELPKKKRQELLKEIETAYTELSKQYLNNVHTEFPSDPDAQKSLEITDEERISIFYSGAALKKIREKADILLLNISLETKIRIEQLKNLEDENFALLPERIFVKGFLNNYADYLSLDIQKVSTDYLKKYDEWKNNPATRKRKTGE